MATPVTALDSSIASLADSHGVALRAEGRSPKTIRNYRDGIDRFVEWRRSRQLSSAWWSGTLRSQDGSVHT